MRRDVPAKVPCHNLESLAPATLLEVSPLRLVQAPAPARHVGNAVVEEAPVVKVPSSVPQLMELKQIMEREMIEHEEASASMRAAEMERIAALKALDEANSVSISLLSMMNALNDESSLQLKAADDSLEALTAGHPLDRTTNSIASLPLSSLHSKLQHADSACESLLENEKGVVVAVMQLMVQSLATKKKKQRANAGRSTRQTSNQQKNYC